MELAIRWKKAPDNVKIKFKNRAKDLQREYSKKLKKFHEKNKNNKKGLGTFKPTTEKNSDSEDEDTDSDWYDVSINFALNEGILYFKIICSFPFTIRKKLRSVKLQTSWYDFWPKM